MIRIGFIIIASEEDPWSKIIWDGQENTWLRLLAESDKYIAAYSEGNLGESWIRKSNHRKIAFLNAQINKHVISNPVFFNDNHARFEGVQGYGSLVGTTLSAMNYLLENYDCDFMVRTNVSSYWDINKLHELLVNKPKHNFYAGCGEKLYSGLRGRFQKTEYASGAGMILSADVAKRMIENRSKISNKFIDDIAIGRIASYLGLTLNKLSRVDIDSIEKLDRLSNEELSSNYHFRCKSYLVPGQAEPRGDVHILKELHLRKMALSK